VKLFLAFLFLALVVASCRRPDSKAEAMSGVAGTWINDWVAPDGAQVQTRATIERGGRWIEHSTFTFTNTVSNMVTTTEYEDQGVVEIKNGCFSLTMTNGLGSHRYSIVLTNDDQFVLGDEFGKSVFRRQK
jgi:hypothetical protein